MSQPELVFRVHAVRRMFEREISEDHVRHVVATGETIEDYPEDTPYPSRLVLGFCGTTRPIHVVIAENIDEGEVIVITVYEPDPARWDSTFRRRKR